MDTSDHTEDLHLQRLNSLCRVCGQRSLKRNDARKILCKLYVSELKTFHDIDILHDDPSEKSETLCKKCYMRLVYLKVPTNVSSHTLKVAKDAIEKSNSIWMAFNPLISRTDCTVCCHFQSQMKGGRPNKPKKGRIRQSHAEHCNNDVPDVVTDTSADSLSEVVSGPSTSTPKKACCRPAAQESELQMPPELFQTDQLRTPPAKTKHLVDCASSPVFAKSPRLRLRPVSDCTLPLRKEEEAYNTHLMRLKMSQSHDKMTATCKTGGQPLIFKKVVKPRKSSTQVSSPTRRQRAGFVGQIRLDVSGGTAEDEIQQHGTEIKKATKIKRARLLEAAGYKESVFLCREKALAMRAALGLSWTQHRKQKRILKRIGVRIESEKKQRQVQKDVRCGSVTIERKHLFRGDDTQAEMPVAYIDDIPQFVRNLLAQLEENNKLSRHNDVIPEDEIWVKIGGDHGGGSFKLMLQIANVENPNSRKNTFLITIVNCKDTPLNIRRVLNRYKTQVTQLQEMNWNEKKLRVFLFGDYDYLLKMYGIAGAQSTHPCLWCKASRRQTQHPKASQQNNIPKRTVQNIRKDYRKYLRTGCNRKKAKSCNNVVQCPVWDIELTHVSPPYLHILLGVVKKHHLLLEQACHDLDQRIGKELGKEIMIQNTTCTPFEKYCQNWREIQILKERKRETETRAAWLWPEDFQNLSEYEDTREDLLGDVEEISQQIDHLKSRNELPFLSGPVTSSLDDALKANGICMQAYHGRSFVGNHCHKYLETSVYENICDQVLRKTMEITDNHLLHNLADDISLQFKTLNTLYSVVHKQISPAKPIASNDMEDLQHSIDRYMAFFRSNFPTVSILPKQHILECHCVDFIRNWGFGLGLHGEQGGEETHAAINQLKRRTWGLKERQTSFVF